MSLSWSEIKIFLLKKYPTSFLNVQKLRQLLKITVFGWKLWRFKFIHLFAYQLILVYTLVKLTTAPHLVGYIKIVIFRDFHMRSCIIILTEMYVISKFSKICGFWAKISQDLIFWCIYLDVVLLNWTGIIGVMHDLSWFIMIYD